MRVGSLPDLQVLDLDKKTLSMINTQVAYNPSVFIVHMSGLTVLGPLSS